MRNKLNMSALRINAHISICIFYTRKGEFDKVLCYGFQTFRRFIDNIVDSIDIEFPLSKVILFDYSRYYILHMPPPQKKSLVHR